MLEALADDVLAGADLSSAMKGLMRRGVREASQGPVGGLDGMLETLAEQRRRILARYSLRQLVEELEELPAAEHMRRFGSRLAQLSSVLLAEWMAATDATGGDPADMVASLARSADLLAAGKDVRPGSDTPAVARDYASADYSGTRSSGEASVAGRLPGEGSAERIEELARSMAAAEALPNSLTPAARRALREVAAGSSSRRGLEETLERLRHAARRCFPGLPWERRYVFGGTEPLNLGSAVGVFSELARIDSLEKSLRVVTVPSDLAGVDLDDVRSMLGPEAASALQALSTVQEVLVQGGLASDAGSRLVLSPAGARRLGERALLQVLSTRGRDRIGRHAGSSAGQGRPVEFFSRPYEFGDVLDLDLHRTIANAVRRVGSGVPVRIAPSDFEVHPRRPTSSSATVLMIDLSLSMPARDNFVVAKKAALALQTLVSARFPRDYLGLVGFSEQARELAPGALAALTWDNAYGTNIQHGLRLARRMLAGRPGVKQVLMITDGEPTAHIGPAGGVVFNYPATAETVEATFAEARAATRDGIVINSFMLDSTADLVHFVDRLSRINGGRVFGGRASSLAFELVADFTRSRSR